jgi:hypothetical protein
MTPAHKDLSKPEAGSPAMESGDRLNQRPSGAFGIEGGGHDDA